MTQSAHAYAYLRPSAVLDGADGRRLDLATSGGATPLGAAANPRFFAGFLADPAPAAAALLAVADVAAARYYQPQLRASLDPVVTANGDRLRFESFSGCCGVYARLDVLGAGLDGDEIGHGTTNVDVNNPLREALTRIGPTDPLHLAVGPDALEVTTFDGPLVEKKVPLPERWLRGFAETQVIAAGFEPRAELPAAEAVRFLRSLPRAGRGGRASVGWVVPAGKALRPTTRPVPGAVCLPGPERLAALQRVLRHALALRVYGPVATGEPTASAWEAVLPGMRLTLTLSPNAARGFSGEGGVLDSLATAAAERDAELIAVLLAWEPRIEVGDLADQSGLSPERVRAALTRLGTAGQIGYDTAEAAYFHRQLPYDAGRAEAANPRLRAARALVEAGAVRLEEGGATAVVTVDDHIQRVRRDESGRLGCTCLWWGKYRGGRGPCKHALAVGMVRESAAGDSGAGASAIGRGVSDAGDAPAAGAAGIAGAKGAGA